jgi:osmotically-inducible protein OsmY
MKYKMHSSLLIFAFAVFAFAGCATTRNMGIANQEGAIVRPPMMVENLDSADQRVDADISSAIRQKFAADGLLSDSNINVDTTGGRVTLKGKVDTQAGADRALQLGRSVDGVKSVRSSLTVN